MGPNDEPGMSPPPRRGTALLVITMIVITTGAFAFLGPRGMGERSAPVRVALIDSGVTPDSTLYGRVVSGRSFITEGNGYHSTDNSTVDSEPRGNPHGTFVARILVKEASNVLIVNAKVVDSNNTATEQAIIEAMRWAVNEEACDIINLSLGGSPSGQDGLREAVRWAFEQGVSVVAAAGNNGRGGVTGSSIESPAVYPQAIAVAAVDEQGRPYYFSGRGPLRNGTTKPDISALGMYTDQQSSTTVYGTSYAAPRVAAAAAGLIAYCIEKGWDWTPGMIKATLMASADRLSSEPWETGAGNLDLDSALKFLDEVPKNESLPLAAYVLPKTGPGSFERWFVNSTVTVEMSVFASSGTTFDLFYEGSASPWVRGPQTILVNQTGSFSVRVHVISGTDMLNLQALVTLIAPGYLSLKAQMKFDASVGFAVVAFDVSHSPWWTDSIYGQFRAFYELLTDIGIAVEEIRDPNDLQSESMLRYDAIVVLDPCAWSYSLDENRIVASPFASYSQSEIEAYLTYWRAGRGLLVAALDNSSIDVESTNQLLSCFNMTLNHDHIPGVTIVVDGIPSSVLVSGLTNNTLAQGVRSFDFNGCSLNFSNGAFRLAWTEIVWRDPQGNLHIDSRTVAVGLEGEGGSRMVAMGSNFFIDNWGINGLYQSTQNSKLALQTVLWLIQAL